MKKFLKHLGITTLSVAVLAYIGFLFVLPRALDLNQFTPQIKDLAKEYANLDVDIENPKVITTPLLGVGIKTDDISVRLPDGSVLFSADGIKTRISIPSLFLLTVKVSCLEIDEPFINLEIENDKQFKVVKLVEELINSPKEQKLEEGKQELEAEQTIAFNPAWIRVKVPNIKISDYKVLINDLKSKHFLKLQGEELHLGYFNGKTVKLKTYAEFFSDENKNITADVNIDTFLPPPAPKLDEEDDPAERIVIPFVNPVTMYRNYDLKANLDTKLRIRNHHNNITSYGHFNVEDVTLKVSNLSLPKSYLRAETFGTNINLDTNIYPVKDQNIELLGKVNYGRHPKLDMNIKAKEIRFNDLIILSKAFLDSLHIQNELGTIRAKGFLCADCYIKTNFKKLKSNGYIKIKDGGVSVRNLENVISKTNINLVLDNNILDIKESGLFVHNSPIKILGKIDEKSVSDISIKVDKIPLPVLYGAFAPKELRESFNFTSGDASFDIALKGKLKQAVCSLKFALANFSLADKVSNFKLNNNKLSGEFFLDKKTFSGKILNNGFGFLLPKTHSNLRAPAFELEIAENNILIKENDILFNDKSKIKYSGEIVDYNKLKSININALGNIDTDDMIKLIGREFKPFINSKGQIPVKLTVEGDNKKQTLFAQALCDKNNFITPVEISNIVDKNTSLQSVIDFKGNRIKIKKTGLFTRNVSIDEEGNEIVRLNEVLGIDGTIAGSNINLIKITIPNSLKNKIFVFPNSDFTLDGKAFIFGETSNPRLRGGFELKNLSIPELLLTLREARLGLKGHSADISVQNLILNGSDMQVESRISLLPASIINITNLDFSSRYFNVDKLMQVVDRAMKYVPAAPATSGNAQSADIPIKIHNGTINLARIISGNIDIRNTQGRISLDRNVFFLRNLRTNIFKGRANGSISMNLITSLMNIDIKGVGIDVEQALLDGAAMKDTLSGTADFDAKISLRGATMEEQMKSLKGDVDFKVIDGQFGPFGKLENLIIAENIRESEFFKTALGGVISGLTTIDTTHFSELNGKLSFNDGICYLDPITSLGNILSLHIFGEFDLLRNYADMKVRARMASLVSNLLGPLGAINPANLLNSAASLNVFTAKAFSIFCEMVPESEIAILPSFSNSYVDNAATKFQLVVRGDAAKPFTLIKSFKWLATETEYNTAVDYVNSLPEPVEGSEATNIEDMIKEVEAEKKTFKYKFKHMFKKETDEKTNTD